MTSRTALRLSALALCVLASCGAARAGLYDDEKRIAAGDIKDLDYWHAKYYHLMFEEALRTHQPEYLVGYLAAAQIDSTLPPLIKKYPNHKGLKQWLAEYEQVLRKVDRHADQLVHWKPDFAYWDYRQAWVNMNLGKMDVAAGDWPDAAERYDWARHNFEILLDHDEFMKNWPGAIINWVKQTHEKAQALAAEMKAKCT